MRKKVIVVLLIAILAIASILSLAGCTSKVEEQAAWEAYEKAMSNSAEHLQNNGSFFIKYRYNGQNSKGEKAVITQKLNVVYGNSNIKDWKDFVVVDKGVEKAARYTTDYLNTYFGYSLKSGVKAKNAKREDYALGYFNTKGEFSNSENVEDLFNLEAGTSYNGNEINADTEIKKYTLAYALGTLDGINRESADLISAEKRGNVLTLKLKVKAEGLFYSNYNQDSNCLVVRITLNRISKISSADDSLPIYFINYAGPKLTLASYDAKKS